MAGKNENEQKRPKTFFVRAQWGRDYSQTSKVNLNLFHSYT